MTKPRKLARVWSFLHPGAGLRFIDTVESTPARRRGGSGTYFEPGGLFPRPPPEGFPVVLVA